MGKKAPGLYKIAKPSQPDLEGVVPPEMKNLRDAAAEYEGLKEELKEQIALLRQRIVDAKDTLMDEMEAAGQTEYGNGKRRYVLSKNRKLRELKDKPQTRRQIEQGHE